MIGQFPPQITGLKRVVFVQDAILLLIYDESIERTAKGKPIWET
jgi:hypothetical protein